MISQGAKKFVWRTQERPDQSDNMNTGETQESGFYTHFLMQVFEGFFSILHFNLLKNVKFK